MGSEMCIRDRYKTPRGKDHWWPAQVQQVLEGRFDGYYGTQTAKAEELC